MVQQITCLPAQIHLDTRVLRSNYLASHIYTYVDKNSYRPTLDIRSPRGVNLRSDECISCTLHLYNIFTVYTGLHNFCITYISSSGLCVSMAFLMYPCFSAKKGPLYLAEVLCNNYLNNNNFYKTTSQIFSRTDLLTD